MAPPSQPTSERRASARVPYRVRAVLSTRLGEVAADVVDISVGGLGVEITGELRNCDFVRVLLPLPPGDDSSEWIDPDALVARVHGKTSSGRTRLGLSFFQLPTDTLRRIAACVANHLDKPHPAPPPAARAEPTRHTTPAATAPPPTSKATTRELPKAAPAPKKPSATPSKKAAPTPKTAPASKAPPLHIPRTSARELRALFHEALASLEEDTGGKKENSS